MKLNVVTTVVDPDTMMVETFTNLVGCCTIGSAPVPVEEEPEVEEPEVEEPVHHYGYQQNYHYPQHQQHQYRPARPTGPSGPSHYGGRPHYSTASRFNSHQGW